MYMAFNFSFNDLFDMWKTGKFKSMKIQKSNPTPIQEGLKTAAAWLTFGLVFDFVCRKFVVFKNSPVKISLVINSALAVLAGGYTAVRNSLKTSSPKSW